MKKVIINNNCIGCGACTGFCDVFKINDETGLATTNENTNNIEKMDNETLENVNDALENCPVNAIEIVEED